MSPWRRVRLVGTDPRLAIGATVGVLLVWVPATVLVALVATGHTGDVGGLVLLVGLLLAGLYVCVDVLRQAPATAAPESDYEQVVLSDGLYGRTVDRPLGKRPSALRAVVVILALLIVVPILFAIVMANLDDHLRGHRTWGVTVVTVLIGAVISGGYWVVGRLTARSAGNGQHRSD